jgi:hypothetical protein
MLLLFSINCKYLLSITSWAYIVNDPCTTHSFNWALIYYKLYFVIYEVVYIWNTQINFESSIASFLHIGRKNRVFQNRMNTCSNHFHNQIKGQHTNVFIWLKPSKREIVHGPNHHNLLREYINAKEKCFNTREFLINDHQQMTPHAL